MTSKLPSRRNGRRGRSALGALLLIFAAVWASSAMGSLSAQVTVIPPPVATDLDDTPVDDIRPVLSLPLLEVIERMGTLDGNRVELADPHRATTVRPPEVVRIPANFSFDGESVFDLLHSRGFEFIGGGDAPEGTLLAMRLASNENAVASVRPFDLLKTFEPELGFASRPYPSAGGDPYFWPDATIDFAGDVPELSFPLIERVLRANAFEAYEESDHDGHPIWVLRTTEGNIAHSIGLMPDPAKYSPPLTLARNLEPRMVEPVLGVLREGLEVGVIHSEFENGSPPLVLAGPPAKIRAIARVLERAALLKIADRELPRVLRDLLQQAGLSLGAPAPSISSPSTTPALANGNAATPTPSNATTSPNRPDPPPANPPAEPPIREKVYYVPFTDLEDVFEAAERGIFLPYDEFLELWRKAEGREPPTAIAPPAPTVVRGGSYRGSVTGDVARISARYTVEALTDGWTATPFPLGRIALESATVSTGFPDSEDEAEVIADAMFVLRNGIYTLLLPGAGTFTVDLVFSVPVTEAPGKKSVGWQIPPLAVSKLDLTLPEADLRVDVTPVVATTQVSPRSDATVVEAFLGDSGAVSVTWMPPVGRAAEGGAIVSAYQEAIASLDERVLRLTSWFDFAVLRGEVDTFRVALPADLQLIAVRGDNVKEWRPEEGILTVALHAPITESYRLELAFEQILDGTPPGLVVPFPNARDVQRESGTVVLAHDPALRVRVTDRTRLSQLDPGEVPQRLAVPGGIGFSYLEAPVSLTLAVEAIEPQLRSESVSVITLGTDEDVWVGWVDASIARAGLFQIALRIPAGWDVDSIGDPQGVEQFQVTDAPAGRTVTVSLRSRALGNLRLPFRFVREGSARPGAVTMTAPVVVGSEQDRGILGITAPRAFELITGTTNELTDTDVDELLRTGILGQVGSDVAIPRAFRYRKHPATAALTLEERRTEIDLLAQHLVEVGDGEVRVTHLLDHDILYAAVDAIRFRAPSSLDDVLSVEVKQKTQVRKLATENGVTTWEVGLQPPALGPLTVTIHHTIPLAPLEAGTPFSLAIPLVEGVGARSTQGFVAVRKEGTLEVGGTTVGMEVIDLGDLPDKLRRGRIASAYRYFDDECSIALELTRYDLEPLATAVVSLMHLRTEITTGLQARTAAILWVQNRDHQFLELTLPADAQLLDLLVDGQRESERKRPGGSGMLIEIPRSNGPAGTFPVIVGYEQSLGSRMGATGRVTLETPVVGDGVPVQEIELSLHLPDDHLYLGWGGNLHRRVASAPSTWERFKGLLGLVAAEAPRASGGHRTSVEGPVTFQVDPERTIEERFRTLSPTGTLRFRYYGRTYFGFIDFLLFVLSAVTTFVVLTKRVRSKPVGAATLIFLALSYAWFTDGPARSFGSSVLFGVLVVCAGLWIHSLHRTWHAGRLARLKQAPDPFIENADRAPGEPAEKTSTAKSKKEKKRKKKAAEEAKSSDSRASGDAVGDDDADGPSAKEGS